MADANAVVAAEIVRAWNANQRVTMLLLSALSEEDLDTRHGTGKTVRGGFGHIHDIRLMWLDSYPDLRVGLTKLGSHTTATGPELGDQLQVSSSAISEMLTRAAGEGRVTGSLGPVPFLAYLVAHEAHHRAFALATLKFCGRRILTALSEQQWNEWRKEGTT